VIRQGVEAGAFEVDDVDAAAVSARALVEGRFIQWLQEADWRRTHSTRREECHRTLLSMLERS
jgi:hypothetical protein